MAKSLLLNSVILQTPLLLNGSVLGDKVRGSPNSMFIGRVLGMEDHFPD